MGFFVGIILVWFARGGQNGMNIAEEIDGKMIKKVLDALTKKATGYETKEVTEEYTNDGEKDVLTKKKICKYYVPADISAAKLLLDVCGTSQQKSYYGMSDEELDNEAIRLFKEYQSLTDKNIFNEVEGEVGEDS